MYCDSKLRKKKQSTVTAGGKVHKDRGSEGNGEEALMVQKM